MSQDNQENEVFEGETVWFNNGKGFGFLKWSKNGVQMKDMFIHHSDINMEGFRTLKQGQKVRFEIGLNLRGDPKAIKCTPAV